MTQSQFTVDRRTVLSSIAGTTLLGLAGCTSDRDNNAGSNGTESSGSSSGPFEQVSVEGLQLVVELTAEAEVEQLNVIAPNGALFDKQELSQGVSRAAFKLGTSYDPGEYRILALRGDDEVGSSTLTIEPELRIVEVEIGANYSGELPDDLPVEEKQAIVTVVNDGIGPDAITKLLFEGGVPTPSTKYEDSDASGIWGPDADLIAGAEKTRIQAGDELSIYSLSMPFSFSSNEGVDCTQDPQEKQFTVNLQSQVAGATSRSFSLSYSGSVSSDGCTVEVIQK
ncbi:hypothetical protein [Haloprofundus halophilus]|uniref:hypothetical protein n=1 Tax=Haloprofundus halophilus TaxID=2283527 RepID=UPI001300B965|nr:hypothetical protein [Haloprofundus halophilus]